MQSKTIKAILKKKITEWIESVKDENLQKLLKKNVIVTGGSIVSLLQNEKPKDYDIYFKNKETVKALAEYYSKKFSELNPGKGSFTVEEDNSGRIILGNNKMICAENRIDLDEPFEDVYDILKENPEVEEKGKEKYRPIFITSNAITLSDKIQCIIRFYGSAEEIHSTYDFVHCTNYYDYDSNHLELKKEALESILSKTLIYQGSKYPVCSVIRTKKFIEKGWHINAGQYLKMLFQVSKLDLTDLSVLEDQLVGVDSAYFNQLIEALKDHKEKNPEFTVDSTYLATIIDRIF